MKHSLLIGIALVSLGACKKSPIERTQDAANPTALGGFGVASTYRIFSNELMTGGGAFEYPGGENQSLDFTDRSNPLSNRSIRYHWTGAPADPSNNGGFAGFDLMHVPTLPQYAGTPGRDLSAAGYTKATFYARGSLSTNTVLKIEVADDGNGGVTPPCLTLSTDGTDNACGGGSEAPQRLTSDWRQYTINIPNNTYLAAVKDFFKATFVYNFPLGGLPGEAPGQGGTVYFDHIQYEP
jgi:hypothetical protein